MWGSGQVGSVPIAETVESAPGSRSGAPLTVVWSSPEDHSTEKATELGVYRITGPARPLWRAPGEASIRTPPPIARANEQWYVASAIVADIFAETPGSEIAVVHASQHSQRAIRVYDLAGVVLFEAWHDGTAGSIAWLPAHRILVLAGDNHERNTAEWGRVNLEAGAPLVVFAIRPDYGGHHAWIHGPAVKPADAAIVTWYRCVMPREAWTRFRLELQPPYGQNGRESRLSLLFIRADAASFTVQLTADGKLTADAPLRSDTFRSDPADFDPDQANLREWPPAGW